MPALVLPKMSDRALVNQKKVSSYSIMASGDPSEDENPKQSNLKSLRLKDSSNHLIVDKRLLAPNAANKFKDHNKTERSEFKSQIKSELEADNQIFGNQTNGDFSGGMLK